MHNRRRRFLNIRDTLPAGYTRLEYLESNGSQYIDTGFVPNGDTRVICDFQFLSENTSKWRCLFGSRDSSNNTNTWGFWTDTSNQFVAHVGKPNDTYFSQNVLGQYIVDINNEQASVGEEVLTYTPSDTSGSYNMYLFAINEAGNPLYMSDARIYSFKIYDNGILVRNYIPCSNGSYTGLYDIVNHTFNMLLGTIENKASISYWADSYNFDATEYEYYLNFEYKPTSNIRVRLRYNNYTFGSDTVVTYKYITTSSQRITIGYSSLVSDTLGNQGWDGEGDFEIISLSPTVDNNYKYTF